MKFALFNVLLLFLFSSCSIENESKQFSISELYSMDLESGKWGDYCYYLNVFDEKCLSEDNTRKIKLRIWVKERNLGTKIISIYSYEENEYIVVSKSIEAAYDGLFTIMTERLPIKYNVLKTSMSKTKFTEWRSTFLALLNSSSSIIRQHNRTIVKVEYRDEATIKKMELRGELSEELKELLGSI